METITITISQSDVYNEVAKATDYTGSKLIDGDEGARDRILAVDDDFKELGRFWVETIAAVEEWLKEMLVKGESKEKITYGTDEDGREYSTNEGVHYEAVLEVSKSWDTSLLSSVQNTMRSYFIASIIGQWFKFANKGESAEYLTNAGEMLQNVERLMYARRRPTLPKD